jgi:hypothetical protein
MEPKSMALVAIGLLALMVLAWQLRGVIIPARATPDIQTEAALNEVATRVVIALNAGTTPSTFDDLPDVAGKKVTRTDGWNRPLTLTIAPAKAKDTLDVVVTSGGADGVTGNDDDYILTAEVVRLLSGEHGVSSQTIQRPPM